MVICVDQREKQPFTFAGIASDKDDIRVVHLKTGDYAEGNCEKDDSLSIIVERKSLRDLYTTLGQHRARFEAEFKRMSKFGYAALVIEADWLQILNPDDWMEYPTLMRPKAVFATLLAWSQRYGVHIWACPGRGAAEKVTYRMLERWGKDRETKAQNNER